MESKSIETLDDVEEMIYLEFRRIPLVCSSSWKTYTNFILGKKATEYFYLKGDEGTHRLYLTVEELYEAIRAQYQAERDQLQPED